ncbi:hypothetical protein FRC03_006998 [Tulasnella sp. 419]|nr:hypothetical protein FRC03_006998 [Tulasnella sp. 419]
MVLFFLEPLKALSSSAITIMSQSLPQTLSDQGGNLKEQLPPVTIGPLTQMDDEARKVFEAVKADILDKIWELHKADDLHDLNEVYKLDHVKFFNPISYRLEEVPYGINYYGKIELNEKGHCIHARVFSPHGSKGPIKFHSVQTRPSNQGGAVFTLEDPLRHFEY